MNILITGASGFFGPFLTAAMREQGVTGVLTSRRPCHVPWAGWSWREREAVLKSAQSHLPDAVVHLEVKQHVFQRCAELHEEMREVNVGGTERWLRWCTEHGVPTFVLLSSIKAVRAQSADAIDESAIGPGETAYGESKWLAEQAVTQWAEAAPGRRALILRPAVMYGGFAPTNIEAMVAAIRRRRFVLIGDGTVVKSLVSVRNAAAATAYLLTRCALGRAEIFNLVDAESCSLRELDRRVRSAAGHSGGSLRLPISVGRLLGEIGEGVQWLTGRDFFVNRSRVRALLESSWFSCEKLKASGFVHPERPLEALLEAAAR
jgi:nucleoside-diphosphate-sugar epimerase